MKFQCLNAMINWNMGVTKLRERQLKAAFSNLINIDFMSPLGAWGGRASPAYSRV